MKRIPLFSLLCLTTIIIAFTGNEKPDVQPIAYNHNKHVQENDMECLDCHVYAEEHARASIPNIADCVVCHEETMTESEAELTLLTYIKGNRAIPWRQIYVVPDYAYFSHRRHVKLAKLECIVCHGDVGKFSEPIGEPFVEVTMDWCMDCHEKKNASNDCYACHR